ncbi:MAG: hypothetical protein FWF52_02970 [Candidatus Azobacteroides sp.]|nr:hypothetical protein [Candidatus Azobacteroides sp.]
MPNKIMIYCFAFLMCNAGSLQAQAPESYYNDAFERIDSMLSGKSALDFKKAVFLTENAYFENQLDPEVFDNYIRFCTSICRGIIASGNILYPESDGEKAAAQCAVMVFMTDTIPIQIGKDVVIHAPFEYNFEDFAGQKEWSSMFVSTLMETQKGNCHSLPFLYKMIMDELGQDCYLSLSPNHIYIKVQNKRVGWYNIELTCGDFPTDAWLMSSGYIHIDALRNGIYMDTLSQKQSAALCLVDLAQAYQAKFGMQDGRFILQCCETALAHFPNYINALLLKAETETALYKQSPPDSETKKKLLLQMNELYTHIHQLGYRKMPEKMYLNWLNSMGTQTTDYRMKSLLVPQDDL